MVMSKAGTTTTNTTKNNLVMDTKLRAELGAELRRRGVSARKSQQLVEQCTEDAIRSSLRWFDDRPNGDAVTTKGLVSAIEHGGMPEYETNTERADAWADLRPAVERYADSVVAMLSRREGLAAPQQVRDAVRALHRETGRLPLMQAVRERLA